MEKQPIETAPRDGTQIVLWIEGGDHPTEDVAPGECWRTIGENTEDINDEQGWRFAGWCWAHDHYVHTNSGTPRFWCPMPTGERPLEGRALTMAIMSRLDKT